MNMNARVEKPCTRTSRLNLSKAALEKLDAIVRDGGGTDMPVLHNAVGHVHSSVQDRQARVENNLQRVGIVLGLRHDSIPLTAKSTLH